MDLDNGHIECTLVNGSQGDPALYVFFPKTGDAALFDIGNIDNLSNKELLRVRHVFVSHTHIDHFIGFDKLLRVNIPHKREIEFCGPPGFIDNVRGKLAGYVWNLLGPEQIKFTVREISAKGEVKTVSLSNTNSFKARTLGTEHPPKELLARPLPKKPSGFVTSLEDKTRIDAVCLDHGTPSVAYVCESPFRFSVRSEELVRLGLEPGPWIRELQMALSKGASDAQIIAGGRTFTARDLGSEVLTFVPPRTVGYVTDFSFERENINRLMGLCKDVDTLFCEATFRTAEIKEAIYKHHVTTKQSALIAALLRVDRLNIFHVSNSYTDSLNEVHSEAQNYFEEFKKLEASQIEELIESEHLEVAKLKSAGQ